MKNNENCCLKCGRCCWGKVKHGRTVTAIKSRSCKFLDRNTNKCLVYPTRRAYYPDCRDIVTAIREGLLPEDCPYVKGMKGYISRVNTWLEE